MKRAMMTERKDRQVTKGGRLPDTAFDQWLNRGLHQMFDDVMNEPVPEELLKILRDEKGESDKKK